MSYGDKRHIQVAQEEAREAHAAMVKAGREAIEAKQLQKAEWPTGLSNLCGDRCPGMSWCCEIRDQGRQEGDEANAIPSFFLKLPEEASISGASGRDPGGPQ